MLKQFIICFLVLHISSSLAGRQKSDYDRSDDSRDQSYDRRDRYDDRRRDRDNYEKCNKNEEWRKCGPACPQTCEYFNKTCGIPVSTCKPKCYCKDGYVRVDGNCFLGSEVCCPDPTCLRQCNEFAQPCAPGCYCYIDPVTLLSVCNVIGTVKIRCPKENQVFNFCPTTCSKTCSDPTGSRCTPTECIPKCVCDDGYLQDSLKNCVLPSCCPADKKQEKYCGDNETFQKCGVDDNVCNTTPAPLPTAIAITCHTGCFCNTGYSRNETNDCIPDSECSGSVS